MMGSLEKATHHNSYLDVRRIRERPSLAIAVHWQDFGNVVLPRKRKVHPYALTVADRAPTGLGCGGLTVVSMRPS